MNTVPFSDFYAHVKQYAAGAADPKIDFALRQAAIDFCQRTKTWRYEDDFQVTDSDAEQIITPNGSVLLDLELVQFDGCDLIPKTPAWLDDHAHGWRTNCNDSGPSKYVTQTEMNTIRLVPYADGHVNIYAWLKPSQDCEDLPDYLGNQYRETIAHGALARLLMMPGMPFSNPNLAGMFITLFNNALDSSQNKGITGQQRARVRTKASFF